MRILRLAKILRVASRYGLDEMILEHEPSGRLAALSRLFHFWRRFDAPRAVRLRLALESLGPIFVKFGQVLSTRRDLMPLDIADELAKLQDRVPPFSADLAFAQIEAAYGRPVNEVFAEFDPVPVASASVAQVHFAKLHAADGAHPQPAGHFGVAPVAQGLHRRQRRLDGGQDLQREAGGPGRARRTVEQGLAEVLLQLLHLLADRAGGHIQFGGGLGDAAQASQRLEGQQRLDRGNADRAHRVVTFCKCSAD